MNRDSLKLTKQDAKKIEELHHKAWKSGKDRSYIVNSNLRFDFRWVSLSEEDDELQISFEISMSGERLVVSEGFTRIELIEEHMILSRDNVTTEFIVVHN